MTLSFVGIISEPFIVAELNHYYSQGIDVIKLSYHQAGQMRLLLPKACKKDLILKYINHENHQKFILMPIFPLPKVGLLYILPQ